MKITFDRSWNVLYLRVRMHHCRLIRNVCCGIYFLISNIRYRGKMIYFLFPIVFVRLSNTYISAGGDPNVLRQLEARRQRALGETTSVLPKILGDELARADGESAGLISGGLGRLLNRFELVGLVGKVDIKDDTSNGEGGRSDMSFTKRHHGHFIMSTAQVAPGMVS